MLVLTVLTACKKNNFNTEPTLTLKSVSDKVVPSNGGLNIVFELTDKEGDISDTLFIKKIRTNLRPVAPSQDLGRDSLTYPIPEVVNTRKVLLQLDLNYSQLISTSRNEPDSLTIQFWIQDKAKNKSNVFELKEVVVIK